MMGETDAQGNLFGGNQLHLEHLGRDSFYGWRAVHGPRVFPDSEFKKLYVLDSGCKSIPPSQWMWMVLLQWYEGTSDYETVQRAKYDLRWKVALDLKDHEGLCAKFTLQTFRGRLLLNELGRELLSRSVWVCREAGMIRSPKVLAALDTSPIIGEAVKDTYNLVADGIMKLVRTLATFEDSGIAGNRDSVEIEAALGDCAYGTALNRREFADGRRELIAKQAALPNQGRLPG